VPANFLKKNQIGKISGPCSLLKQLSLCDGLKGYKILAFHTISVQMQVAPIIKLFAVAASMINSVSRNLAHLLLWNETCFMPSSRRNPAGNCGAGRHEHWKRNTARNEALCKGRFRFRGRVSAIAAGRLWRRRSIWRFRRGPTGSGNGGAMVGGAGPSVFAGQILDADILFCPTGQVTFATPGALPQSAGSYDLESLLIHEIGSQLGLDYSGLWRSAMFPFPPPPGTYLGNRPTNLTPDAPLADGDRAGLLTLYADGSDTTDIGIVRRHVFPANPFKLATVPLSSPGVAVSGVMSAQVVAADAVTGEIFAAMLGGWSCSPATGVPLFDGFYALQPLPLNRNYSIYAEPLIGPLAPQQFTNVTAGLCNVNGMYFCTRPLADTNLSARFQPASSP